jgi:hypothetical protein
MSQPIQEEDRIATGKILATAIVSLIIFGIGVLWAISIQRGEMHSLVTPLHNAEHAVAGAPEVGIVYQWPFNISDFGPDHKKKVEAQLNSFGWVDKNAKVVHIPIEEAMKKYVAQSGGQK